MTKFTKLSIGLTISILVIGGIMVGRNQKRLDGLEAGQQQLVETATRLGLADKIAGLDVRITKRQRDEVDNEARGVAAALIVFAREMEVRGKSGMEDDEESNSRAMDLMNRVMKLDAPQLKRVIAGLRDDTSLSAESRANMIGFAIMVLGEDHPAAALALYTESADLLGDGVVGLDAVASSLRLWARQDPSAALAWVRANEEAHPDIADEDARHNIIAGAALTDPGLALQLMGEMKLEDPEAAIGAVVESAEGPDKRTEVIRALRAHLSALSDAVDGKEAMAAALETMGRDLSNEDFASVTAWMKDAALTPEEAAAFASGLSWFNTGEDTGKWIAWMGQNLPEAEARQGADSLIGQWTQEDYLAAGNWLAAAPEGPAKDAAVATYAATVAEYEPQVAVQWALRLPEGEEKKTTLEMIYQEWPERDAAAREVFAKEYGVDVKAGE
jgi:hypothetical protein